MGRKYQVFISSPQQDLLTERKSIILELLKIDCIPSGMELFNASDRTSWDIIEQEIRESDFFVLILAGKYGSLTEDFNGEKISYTEKEYNFALSLNKPIYTFFRKNIEKLPVEDCESQRTTKRKLEKFKKKVLDSEKQIFHWNNPNELIMGIKDSIQEAIRLHPNIGWVNTTELNQSGLDSNFTNKINDYNYWGMEKIFNTRAEKNSDSDPKLEKHNVKKLDGVAFGLTSFRTQRENDILKCLNNGMQMRLLVMDPNSEFVKQREIEEDALPNSISHSINKLVSWVNKLNSRTDKGKIEIKFYNSMTLDFYWRMDDDLYVGPYLYGVVSQQTITYKFVNGGKGFQVYTDYFDSLWNNEDLCFYPQEFIKK